MSTDNIAYGTYTALTVTNLQSLAIDTSSPYAGWQSDRIDNNSPKAVDFEIVVHLPMANTAAANDQAIYLYIIPWVYDGSAWKLGGNFSTTTNPTGSEGTASIVEPNSMKGPIVLPYITQNQTVNGFFNIASLCGGVVPDGFSLALRNNSGAALSTGCIIAYRAITYTSA